MVLEAGTSKNGPSNWQILYDLSSHGGRQQDKRERRGGLNSLL